MSLPRRQQQILNQIEQALQTADPKLKSMFAAFGRSVRAQSRTTAGLLPETTR
jgi:hypothetical protein